MITNFYSTTKSTLDSPIGLLINGVELYSPSVFDESIYYGEIEDINLLNPGKEFDVVNPSSLFVLDPDGEGAEIIGNVKGKFKEVLVLSPGIGYSKKPSLSVVGGNPDDGIKLETNLIKKSLTAQFIANETNVSSANRTIKFLASHNFEDTEEVIYISNKLTEVTNLVSGSYYYVGIVNDTTVKLYNTKQDAIDETNPIQISVNVGIHSGLHEIRTKDIKNVIDEVYITSATGFVYNKSIKIPSVNFKEGSTTNGISTVSDFIYAKGHNFREKDVVVYETTGTNISGLSTISKYFISLIDENSFKLYDAGVNEIPDTTNYENKTSVSLNSVGVGTHTFKYEPIQIKVSVTSGISSTKPPVLYPVISGEFDSTFIVNPGSKYGCDNIVDYHRRPEIRVGTELVDQYGFDAEAVLYPIIIDSKIVGVQILNSGSNYEKDIEIIADGAGQYAKLFPTVTDGKITNVSVLSSGSGYIQGKTSLVVKRKGYGAKFLVNIKKWTIDQYVKNKNLINSTPGEGFSVPSRNNKNSVQFINFYPPKELLDSVKDDGSSSSGVIGWAYDGNPIYGPFVKINNEVKEVISGYKIRDDISQLELEGKRPNLSVFPEKSFIEDYVFDSTLTDLDETNSKYLAPSLDFPNGVNAYFYTMVKEGNSYVPSYPYIIGKEFKNLPILNNFKGNFNQGIDFSSHEYVMNTSPLNLLANNSGYEYIKTVQEKYKQNIIVKNTLKSGIDGIKIIESGDNYKVKDKINFARESYTETFPICEVSRLTGRNITSFNVGVSTITGVKYKTSNSLVIGITTVPHQIKTGEYVGLTTFSDPSLLYLVGTEVVSVKNKIVNLSQNVPSSTGISTYISLNDVTDFEVDDFIKIDNEILKIISISYLENKLYVNRAELATSQGIHTAGISTVVLLPTRFEFTSTGLEKNIKINNKVYFNPSLSVGLGTSGSTYNTGVGNSYFVPPNQLYIENHGFVTNEPIVYQVGAGGTSLIISTTGTGATSILTNNGVVYAINYGNNYLGISTNIGYPPEPLYFRSNSESIGKAHIFEQYSSNTTGTIETVILNISTDNAHNLETGDKIKFYADSATNEYSIIKNDYNLEYPISKVNSTSFNINLPINPENKTFSTLSNVKYTTNSKNSKGGIYEVQVKYPGTSYSKLPLIESIDSEEGNGAKLIPYSNKIGKIDTVEIVKSGFDYPSDITLTPKLSTTTIAYLDNIYKIKEVKVIYGGKNYNTPPKLKIKGNTEVILTTNLKNSIVDNVVISKNSNRLSSSLEIIPFNNSNGYEIANIENSAGNGRITLNTDDFPLIYRDYAEPIVDFPFKVGDLIYIENCNVGVENGPNSSNYNDKYFEVIGVNETLGYIDYDITGVGVSFGTYPNEDEVYGTVVNKKDLARFEMVLEKGNYISGEPLVAYNTNGGVKFTGNVMKTEGWNESSSQIRIENCQGVLEYNDVLYGLSSLLEGVVIDVNSFELNAKLSSSRTKVNYLNKDYGDLNNSLKKIQDSNYYQEFSYSIISHTPYSSWKEPVKSIVHPSGYKEFSNLQVISKANDTAKVKVLQSNLEVVIKVDSEKSFSTKNNFTVGYESANLLLDEFTTERVFLGSGQQKWPVAGVGFTNINGINILPYILNKTNNVVKLKDISSQFTGTYDLINITTANVTFDSQSPYYLGISTSGLQVGDVIGYSSYNSYPENTIIKSVGINSVQLWNPHLVYTGIVTESLQVNRRINNNQIVGLSSFILSTNENNIDFEVLSLTVSPSGINTSSSKIEIRNYFQKGQKIRYKNIGGSPISIATTTLVEGGLSTSILPSTLYVSSTTLNSFEVSGLSTSTKLTLASVGSGTHIFSFDNPNNCTLIGIDNVIQSPIYPTDITLPSSSSVGLTTNILYVNSGINSITSNEILRIDDEYFKIKAVGVGSTNAIQVERAFVGSSQTTHLISAPVKVYKGNYNIVDNIIYFTSSPFGPAGNPEYPASSQFSGRVFTRGFNSATPNDKNFIFDDISNQFTGIGTFTLKENGSTLVGVYTNTNSNVNISNNPIILINNVPQNPEVDFTIQNQSSNEIYFSGESPISGKILTVEGNQASGYIPLVGASATVSVSPIGEIQNIYLTGAGSGYRKAPGISIISNNGSGGIITATVGASGTITGLTLVNPGVGYTTTEPVIIDIDEPLPYFNLNLQYHSSSSGIGTGATVSVSIGSTGDVVNYTLESNGKYYKVGDILTPVGITTDPSYVGSIEPLKLTVTKVFSDTFSGMYPGQFIKFNDISGKFNSVRKAFDLYYQINGISQKITLRRESNNNFMNVENNFFILINDILQDPGVAYIYSGDRIIFREAPKAGSSCSILFFRGSSIDVEEITPISTFKEGDVIKFEDSELSNLDDDQLERVIKRLVSASSFDTFTYTGYGIIDSIPRPLTWDRQKEDRIINGALVSKSRVEMRSRLVPNCKLIKNVSTTDTELYVDNAYPIFVDIDLLKEEKRNVRIIDGDATLIPALLSSQVSASSTISNIVIENQGAGYLSPPVISIGNSSKINKDILYNWKPVVGVSTTYTFNSIYGSDIIVSVGNSGLVAVSTNMKTWEYDNVIYPQVVNFNDVVSSTSGNFVSVGSSGAILIRNNSTETWSSADKKVQVVDDLFVPTLEDSSYTGTFNSIVYDEFIDIYLAVGTQGKIYYCNNIDSNEFIEASFVTNINTNNITFNSISYNSNIIVAVGDIQNGISYDGKTWFIASPVPGVCKDIIWVGNKFVAASNNGVYQSTDGQVWFSVSNPSLDFKRIRYYENQYVGITTAGNLYYSFDLQAWYSKLKGTNESLNDFTQSTIDNLKYYGFVGSAGTIIYTTPVKNHAVAISSVTSGQLTSITILNSGFGYSQENPPEVLVESPKVKVEDLLTIKAIGDFGTIVGINTFPVGTPGIGTTTPKLEFELKTNYYDNDNLGIGYSSLNTFGIDYSQLNVGDYFIIQNSNVICGHALTGITTSLGGMANYPTSRVGTANSFIDGVYRVEAVKLPSTPVGIVTVSCNFVPVNNGLALSFVGVTTNYYGNYSWSKIYDYENRAINSPTSFTVNTNNGLSGISTAPSIYRKTSLGV